MTFKSYSGRGAVALACFAGTVLLTAPAWAQDDKPIYSAVMEAVGLNTDPTVKSIDYGERNRLVLPPNSGSLPEPAARPERRADWPRDGAGAVKRGDNRFARIPNAPPEPKKPGLLERIRGPRENTGAGADDEPGLLQRVLTAKARAAAAEPDVPARRLLTEPPDGYRQPTKPLSDVRDADAKVGILGRLTNLGGGGSDSDPVAQPGSGPIARPENADGGGPLSSLRAMMPSFMRDPN
jgi:hypothetical protein